MKKWIAIGGLLAVLTLPITVRAYTVPVIDIAALSQMFAEAVWWVEDLAWQASQYTNQILQIEQQVLVLESWALALKNLDFTILPVVGGPMGSILQVFTDAQNIFFNAALIKEQFEELYAPFHGTQMPSFDYFTKAFDWNKATRDAHWIAMQQQAHIVVSFDATHLAMQQALTHSEAAVGPLQAAQAGNQLLGTQIAQQNETNALLGTLAHGQSVRDMNEAAAQDQALLRLSLVMEGWTQWTKTDGLAALPTTFK